MRSSSWHGGWIGLGVFSALLLSASLSLGGCRERNTDRQSLTSGSTSGAPTGGAETAPAEPGPPPENWPRVLVIGPGSGPALFLGPDDRAAAVGYLNPGVRVRLESAPMNGRVKIISAGALQTKGWVPLDRLAAYAQRKGRVDGTRTYLGPNDLVGILGPAEQEGQMRVEVRPWLGGSTFLGPFVGTFPSDGLGSEEVDPSTVEPLSEGQCYQLPAGQTVPVYERPTGQPVASLPATNPPASVVVLLERNGWYGIRAGYGPYLTGFIQVSLTPCQGPRPQPEPMVPHGDGEMPYWMSQEEGPLERVAAGTLVRFHDHTIARLRAEGWARELGRQADNQVDVFVAVDDEVALRGLVPADALTPVPGQEGAATAGQPAPAGAQPNGTPPAQTQPAPQQEELPPELQ